MLGTLFDKVTGLFDSRFVLALLLPAFAFAAGVGALAVTMTGWHQAAAWWAALDAARQVALGVAAAAAIVVLAVIIGTQVVAMTRLLEGYWRWRWVIATLGRLGRWREKKRRTRLAADATELGYLHGYLAFPPDPAPVLPTRLGNALRAAESYPGDKERWGLDAAFWWPRLYLILPDSARDQVDGARASLDQLAVLTMLSAAFGVVALALSCHWLNLWVGVSCGIGALLLSRCTYLAAVTAAGVFGELVRSSYDLFRGDLLAKLGWAMPATLAEERRLWAALSQQLYRRGTDTQGEALLKAPRQPPAAP
jgi:MFS family permease